MRVWKALLDIRCGIDSAIPLCCIAWFIGPWQTLLRASWQGNSNKVKNLWALKAHLRYYNAVFRQEFEHIPCPRCLFRRRLVVVRKTPFPDDLLTRLLIQLDSV